MLFLCRWVFRLYRKSGFRSLLLSSVLFCSPLTYLSRIRLHFVSYMHLGVNVGIRHCQLGIKTYTDGRIISERISTEHCGVAVSNILCIWVVPGSNLLPDTGYPRFHNLPQCGHTSTPNMIKIGHGRCPAMKTSLFTMSDDFIKVCDNGCSIMLGIVRCQRCIS
jgi:hypothetical protein